MSKLTLGGIPISTSGELPRVGSTAPDFRLVDGDLADKTLTDWKGKVKILNIVPSLDTPVCALSAKYFNREAGKIPGLVVLIISCDLPFAQGRFCKTEGATNVIPLSQMRDSSFGQSYGVEIMDGPLAGILSRAVVVLDSFDQVIYTQQVPEIHDEPDYTAALRAAREALSKT
jgi:thiol peroxidase